MIAVTIDLHPGGDPVATTAYLLRIVNVGPVAPDETDPGGERVYEVTDEVSGESARVTHFRRDGLLRLVVKSLKALP